jgi:hypothetical protein
MNRSDSVGVHPLVVAFRRDLRRALNGVPWDQRQRVLDDIDTHLADALAGSATEAEVREVLGRLGSPESIATEAGSVSGPSSLGREAAAIILLSFGAILFWFVGWGVGVWCLWTSRRWNRRDKVIGTLGTVLIAFGPLGVIVVGSTVGRVLGQQAAYFGGPALAVVTVGYLGWQLNRTR